MLHFPCKFSNAPPPILDALAVSPLNDAAAVAEGKVIWRLDEESSVSLALPAMPLGGPFLSCILGTGMDPEEVARSPSPLASGAVHQVASGAVQQVGLRGSISGVWARP